jgi:hypothetical protein
LPLLIEKVLAEYKIISVNGYAKLCTHILQH